MVMPIVMATGSPIGRGAGVVIERAALRPISRRIGYRRSSSLCRPLDKPIGLGIDKDPDAEGRCRPAHRQMSIGEPIG